MQFKHTDGYRLVYDLYARLIKGFLPSRVIYSPIHGPIAANSEQYCHRYQLR